MAKYDVYITVNAGFTVTVDATNAEDAARIVQDELTFADIFETSGTRLSEIDYVVAEVNKSEQ